MLGMDPSTAANGATSPPPNNPLAAMMASLGMPNPGEAAGGPDGPDPNDPMMKMLSQMMAGAGGGGPGGGPGGAKNPFAAMAGGGGGAPQQQQQSAPDTTTAAIWRVLHFLVAAGLGLYIALLTQFTGTKVARERSAFAAYSATDAQDGGVGGSANAEDLRRYFFWAFATAESILLTTRFFLDKGARGPSGMVATVLGFVPESKWKSLVVNGMQYVQIFGTVRMDMLVCVFVLGICSLVKG